MLFHGATYIVRSQFGHPIFGQDRFRDAESEQTLFLHSVPQYLKVMVHLH
jgi:hypothetical protein